MLNEGIENTTVQFAAEKSPLRMKKFLKNHLLTNGIKVREDRTMKRRTGSVMSRSSTYDNDLFNGITFYTHDGKDIGVQVKGNSIRLNIGDSSFTESMGNMLLKDLGDFIVESYKKAKTPKTSTPSIDMDAELEKLNNELGDKFEVRGKSSYSGRYGPDFTLRINSHKFDVKIDNSNSRILDIARKLLSDPVVKRSLSKYDKDVGEQRLHHSSIMHEKLPYIRDEVFEAVEKFIDRIYSLGIDVVSAGFESGEIRVEKPRTSEFNPSKPPERRKRPTLLKKEDVIRKIKKQIIKESSYKKSEFNEYISKLEEVAHPALKRFFKNPEKYI